MNEPEKNPPQSIDQAADKFIKELLRYFHQDPPDVSEEPEEAAAA